jgi:hypothetical protein
MKEELSLKALGDFEADLGLSFSFLLLLLSPLLELEGMTKDNFLLELLDLVEDDDDFDEDE